jgi:lysophospholipase L1-like esterase
MKIVKTTLDDTMKFILEYQGSPDVIILHSLTNDLKFMSPNECVEKLFTIVDVIPSKWPTAKIIVSGTTPRGDDTKHNANGRIINAYLQQRVEEMKGPIYYVEHGNMSSNGNPNPGILAEDKYHLSTKGVSLLAKNLKWKIHSVLEIPQGQRRPRSTSRHFRGFRR